jgi:uncharacterized CHY-type Zn-finger protein
MSKHKRNSEQEAIDLSGADDDAQGSAMKKRRQDEEKKQGTQVSQLLAAGLSHQQVYNPDNFEMKEDDLKKLHLVCGLCELVLVDPKTFKTCDDVLCGSCAAGVLAKHPQGGDCPLCTVPFTPGDVDNAVGLIRKQVAGLIVKCTHRMAPQIQRVQNDGGAGAGASSSSAAAANNSDAKDQAQLMYRHTLTPDA